MAAGRRKALGLAAQTRNIRESQRHVSIAGSQDKFFAERENPPATLQSTNSLTVANRSVHARILILGTSESPKQMRLPNSRSAKIAAESVCGGTCHPWQVKTKFELSPQTL